MFKKSWTETKNYGGWFASFCAINLRLLLFFSRFIIHLFDFQDTILVIERYKSGFEPPGDFPFDDLSRGGESTPLILPGSGNTYVSSGVGAHRSESMTVKGTMSAGKLKKRVGLFAIFSSNKVYIIMHRNYLKTFMTTIIITFIINYYIPSI